MRWTWGGLLVAVTATVGSYLYIDHPLAQSLARGRHTGGASKLDLPDLLLILVILVTVGGWACRFWLPRAARWDRLRGCAAALGIAAPLAYVVKDVSKLICGRPTTRLWLEESQPDVFHWFQGLGEWGGFPSGHMLVLVALGSVMWRHYPQWARWYGWSLVALACALIATNYHFLSDVLAGAYVGRVLAVRLDRAPLTK